jgi:hypothetical protein
MSRRYHKQKRREEQQRAITESTEQPLRLRGGRLRAPDPKRREAAAAGQEEAETIRSGLRAESRRAVGWGSRPEAAMAEYRREFATFKWHGRQLPKLTGWNQELGIPIWDFESLKLRPKSWWARRAMHQQRRITARAEGMIADPRAPGGQREIVTDLGDDTPLDAGMGWVAHGDEADRWDLFPTRYSVVRLDKRTGEARYYHDKGEYTDAYDEPYDVWFTSIIDKPPLAAEKQTVREAIRNARDPLGYGAALGFQYIPGPAERPTIRREDPTESAALWLHDPKAAAKRDEERRKAREALVEAAPREVIPEKKKKEDVALDLEAAQRIMALGHARRQREEAERQRRAEERAKRKPAPKPAPPRPEWRREMRERMAQEEEEEN